MHIEQQSATTTEMAEFRCTSCGHQATAVVTGIGEGTQSFLNAQGEAARRADADARADVQRVLSVTRCPRCGKRDANAVRAWWIRRIGPVLLTVVGIAAAGWAPLIFDINMSESDKWMAAWVTTGIALVVGIPFALLEGPLKWSLVDGQVALDPQERDAE